jgi:ABC-type multidrug transport system permease subunit
MAKRKKNKRTEAVNQWTDNTMAKTKDQKYRSRKSMDNTMASVLLFFFLLAMVLSLHRFTASVPLFFVLLAMVLSVHQFTASVLLFFFFLAMVLSVH